MLNYNSYFIDGCCPCGNKDAAKQSCYKCDSGLDVNAGFWIWDETCTMRLDYFLDEPKGCVIIVDSWTRKIIHDYYFEKDFSSHYLLWIFAQETFCRLNECKMFMQGSGRGYGLTSGGRVSADASSRRSYE
jgi:hypothetical protein